MNLCFTLKIVCRLEGGRPWFMTMSLEIFMNCNVCVYVNEKNTDFSWFYEHIKAKHFRPIGWYALGADTLSKVRTTCPKFGHPVQSSDTLSKVRILTCQVKNLFFAENHNLAKIVNELLILIMFYPSNGDSFIFVACLQQLCLKCVI